VRLLSCPFRLLRIGFLVPRPPTANSFDQNNLGMSLATCDTLVFLVSKHGRGFRWDSCSLSQGVGHDSREQVKLFIIHHVVVVFFWVGCVSPVASSFPTLISFPARSFSLIIRVSAPSAAWSSCRSLSWWWWGSSSTCPRTLWCRI